MTLALRRRTQSMDCETFSCGSRMLLVSTKSGENLARRSCRKVVGSSKRKDGSRARFEQVDVLRGIAAFVVVLSHYVPHIHKYSGNLPLMVSMEFGHYAVKLFFAISGFVIFYSLERCQSVADFVWLRVSRLYPAYWLAVLLSAVISPLLTGETIWVGGVLTNLTMLQEFLGYPHIDAVYWSLTVELAFYCNVVWLFAFGWHRRPEIVSLVWLSLAGIWAVTFFDFTPGNAVRSGAGALLFSLDYAAYFVIGLMSFAASRHGWSAGRIALILIAIAVESFMFRVEGALTACVVAFLLIAAVNGYLSLLVSRVTLWLGAISYSLYLTHRNLGYSFSKWLLQYLPNGWVVLGISIAGALLLATFLTYSVERPMAAFLRHRWSVRSAQ